jgi:hypothetical protein
MADYWQERSFKTRQFLNRVWHLDNDERPAYLIGIAVEAEGTLLDRYSDPDKQLRHYLKEIQQHQDIKDDYIPALWPNLGVGIFPSAFGCQVRWPMKVVPRENLSSLFWTGGLILVKYNRVDPSKLATHIFHGVENIEKAWYLMKEKPADLIKPVVIY